MFTKTIIFVGLLSILLVDYVRAAPAFISDSLVTDLNCQELTEYNVLSFIKQDAFSADRHFPKANWAANGLGQCWSLSLAQRRMFYLARFTADPTEELNDETDYALRLIGNRRLKRLRVFSTHDFDMNGRFFSGLESGSPLRRGYDFERAIESRQIKRFLSLANLGMLWGGRERREHFNKQTLLKILESRRQGRMPLLILKSSRFSQHAVLVKEIENIREGEFALSVYDSNQPDVEPKVYFREGEFYAPDVIRRSLHLTQRAARDATRPLGVFLKDERDMDRIQKAVYAHYREACKNKGPTATTAALRSISRASCN